MIILNILYVCIFLLVVATIGFIRICIRREENAERYEFADLFWNKLEEYIESNGRDNKAYSWMMTHSVKMQTQLGSAGIISFKPAFSNYIVHNAPIISNYLPLLRDSYYDSFSKSTLTYQYASSLQDTLLRHFGDLEEHGNFLIKRLKNPIEWITEGMFSILSIPLLFIKAFGLISQEKINKIRTSIVFKLFGIAATLMTIIVSWEDFIKIVKRFIP